MLIVNNVKRLLYPLPRTKAILRDDMVQAVFVGPCSYRSRNSTYRMPSVFAKPPLTVFHASTADKRVKRTILRSENKKKRVLRERECETKKNRERGWERVREKEWERWKRNALLQAVVDNNWSRFSSCVVLIAVQVYTYLLTISTDRSCSCQQQDSSHHYYKIHVPNIK